MGTGAFDPTRSPDLGSKKWSLAQSTMRSMLSPFSTCALGLTRAMKFVVSPSGGWILTGVHQQLLDVGSDHRRAVDGEVNEGLGAEHLGDLDLRRDGPIRVGAGDLRRLERVGTDPDHELLVHLALDAGMRRQGPGIDFDSEATISDRPHLVALALEVAVGEVHRRASDEPGDEEIVGVVEEVSRTPHLLQVEGAGRGNRA